MPEADRPGSLTAKLRRPRIFPDLMRHRVRRILLVASLYDSFILTEDGRLNEALMRQFLDLNLDQNPDLIRVSNGAEALAIIEDGDHFDMIITSLQLGDMNAAELARHVKEAGLAAPVVVLAYNNRELTEFLGRHARGDIDRVFLWQGDVRVLLAMVKDQEDRMNLARDTGQLGVPAILVVEDSVRFYSSFLPMMYAELMEYAQRLVSEGLNLSQKVLRLRARPKLLLCESFEAAWDYFEKYEENILGVLSDFEFPRGGTLDRNAGEELVSRIRMVRADIPIIMQSSKPANEAAARRLSAAFLLKDSPLLLHRLRELLLGSFGFGDFVFRTPDGVEIDRASDLKSLEAKLQTVPAECVVYHGERNHFSMWLKARTEFELADRLRPRRVSDYSSPRQLQKDLVRAIGAYRLARDRAVVADFNREDYDTTVNMARIGTGSLGGKARGLAFANRLLLDADAAARFPGVEISVPTSVVLGTGVFDEFLERNRLADFALGSAPEAEIRRRFAAAPLQRSVERDLKAFLEHNPGPLAVRSSGLLEDSPSQPLAGVYRTIMLPNRGRAGQRLADLVTAVKSVYASTFSRDAQAFLRMTPFRLEEEKMAVIIQNMVGAAHGDRFYPDFSGVARSYNVYPTPPMSGADGIAAVALGLGRAVVEGDACLRFSPRHPRHVLAFSDVDMLLQESQREFFALDLAARASQTGQDGAELSRYGLQEAEADGTLAALGSTYSTENNAIYDGIGRPGTRLVSFAPILKHGQFPLAELLEMLLATGREGTGGEVEIEFAVNLSVPQGSPGAVRLPADAAAGAGRGARRARDRDGSRCRGDLSQPGGARPRPPGSARPRGRRSATLRPAAQRRGGRAGCAHQRQAAGRAGALCADRRGALGVYGPPSGNPGHLEPDSRGPRHRRIGIPGPARHAVAGHPFLPEPDLAEHRLLHGQPAGRRRLRGLGLAGGTTGAGRHRFRSPPAARQPGRGDDERQVRRRDHRQAAGLKPGPLPPGSRPSGHQHRRAVQLPVPQPRQRLVGVAERKGLNARQDAEPGRERHELEPVGAGQVGHRAQRALAPQQRIGERRDVAHVDAAADDDAARPYGGQRRRHERADRGEDDGGVQRHRRGAIARPRPLATELAGERRRAGVARAREGITGDAAADRDLRNEVGRGAEAVQAEPARAAAHLERALPDQAGAKQRRGMHVVEAGGNGQAVARVGHDELRKAAVHVTAGEAGQPAQVLLAGGTPLATPAGPAQPRHAQPRPGRQVDARAAGGHLTHDFVPGDDRVGNIRQLAVHHVQVGAADGAGAYAQQHLARSGLGNRAGSGLQSPGATLGEHRAHGASIRPCRRGRQRDIRRTTPRSGARRGPGPATGRAGRRPPARRRTACPGRGGN